MSKILAPIQAWIQKEEHCEDNNVVSLWRPLKFALARLNGYPKLNKIGDVDDKEAFLKELKKYDLQTLLPIQNPSVVKMGQLFELGMTGANVMNFPAAELGEKLASIRRQAPFYDYMPHFLYECFQGGSLETFIGSDSNLVSWIKEQHLEMFFYEHKITREKIKDLTGMNDYRKSIPLNLEVMLDNYIEILSERTDYL